MVWRPPPAPIIGRGTLEGLVDLEGFETSTSSMPSSWNQSLTSIDARNTRLSGARLGRHLDATEANFTFGLQTDSTNGLCGGGCGSPRALRTRAVVPAFRHFSRGEKRCFPMHANRTHGALGSVIEKGVETPSDGS